MCDVSASSVNMEHRLGVVEGDVRSCVCILQSPGLSYIYTQTCFSFVNVSVMYFVVRA